jgi:hypothetical protein
MGSILAFFIKKPHKRVSKKMPLGYRLPLGVEMFLC